MLGTKLPTFKKRNQNQTQNIPKKTKIFYMYCVFTLFHTISLYSLLFSRDGPFVKLNYFVECRSMDEFINEFVFILRPKHGWYF